MTDEEAEIKAKMLVLWLIANGYTDRQIQAGARWLQGKGR